jgi:lipopolysaccharide transport system ATP-binding protein
MSDIAIRVENLSKRYRIGLREEMHDTLVGATLDFARRPGKNLQRLRRLTRFRQGDEDAEDIIWALREVSFEVARGEVVGVIGRNGAGKTTLLKILSRITHPTGGRVALRGRVSSLLEVGTGFHAELTGRENIYLNGTILGMRKAEIDHKFDQIVDFSGVEKFIDTPVKRYSSGMRVRLAFSVAAHLEPEILLVDEVLAVGDVAFQRKCLGKMDEVARGGRAVLFVSHNMAAVQSLCSRSILLIDGRIECDAGVDEAIAVYLSSVEQTDAECSLASRQDRQGKGPLKFTSIAFRDAEGKELESVMTGQTVDVIIDYETSSEIDPHWLNVSIGFRDHLGRFLFNCPSQVFSAFDRKIAPKGSLVCTIPRFPLLQGKYYFNLFAAVNQDISDWIREAGTLQVIAGDFYGTGKLPPSSHQGVLVGFTWKSV